MARRQGDPRECLKFMEAFLRSNDNLLSQEWIPFFIRVMETCDETDSRCSYLNMLVRIKPDSVLNRFINDGGYLGLNSWLVCSMSTSDAALLRRILLTLKKLPLRVEHLKMNNTARLVWQLSKEAKIREVRRLARSLVEDWVAEIVSHCQLRSGNSTAAETS